MKVPLQATGDASEFLPFVPAGVPSSCDISLFFELEAGESASPDILTGRCGRTVAFFGELITLEGRASACLEVTAKDRRKAHEDLGL
jgi:hypothetical protein